MMLMNLPGSHDPHIWLDFDNAKIMVKNISQALEAKDLPKGLFMNRRPMNTATS